ncbi:hypothetical protein [Thalassotalea montiporae]
MSFNHILHIWLKGELLQGKVMILIGVLLLLAAIAMYLSQNELLRGGMLPLGFLVIVLIGYGGFILQSRVVHVTQSEALYQSSPPEAIVTELNKHNSDNKIGNTLLKVYPVLVIVSMVALMLMQSGFYQGMALGFALVFISAFIIDYGFVSRSNIVINSISKL